MARCIAALLLVNLLAWPAVALSQEEPQDAPANQQDQKSADAPADAEAEATEEKPADTKEQPAEKKGDAPADDKKPADEKKPADDKKPADQPQEKQPQQSKKKEPAAQPEQKKKDEPTDPQPESEQRMQSATQRQDDPQQPSQQDTPADQPADAQPAAAEAELTAEQFDALLAEWKQIIARLSELQLKYKEVPPDERPPLREEFEKLVKRGEELQPKLIRAAEKIYAAQPTKDGDLALFLAQVANDDLRSDRYEDALRRAELLIKHGFENARVYNVAGVAAFSIDRFDLAQQYLTKAQEAGALDDEGRNYAGMATDYQELWAEEQKIREAEAKADDLPRVRLQTSKGEIVIELYENEAPNTVANFISLVEKDFYNGVVFHRVLPGFMAQGGDPTGSGSGGPGYRIECECDEEDARTHFRGSLSMAHAGPDTGGSQFFITFRPTPHLDGRHTVFGRVIEGLDVLAKLQRRDPQEPSPPQPDKIVKAEVVRKRAHEYKPETLPE